MMDEVTKDLLEALRDIQAVASWGADIDPQRAVRIARAAIARAEAALDSSDDTPPSTEERRLRRMLCRQRHGVSAYMDDGEATFGGDEFQRPTDYLRESLDSIEQAWIEAGRKQVAQAEPRPDADGWINPNDKTKRQYLPHIGEKVLFCHAGVTYYGKHTGGSFQSFNPPRRFCAWDCLWMYPPKAPGAQP